MSIYDYTVEKIDGTSQSLEEYRGKVILIVNTASKCGFTTQFAGLETLYEKYREKGLIILGFPCNQFKQQDPNSNADILEFCQRNYGVSFPMFAKIDVNGDDQAPLYAYLTKETGSEIEWNFTKFLIDSDGKLVKRLAPKERPESFESEIETLLT